VRGDDLSERLDAIVDFPWEALEYERWVESVVQQSAGPSDDYLFGQSVSRFIPDDADVLVVARGLVVERASGGAVVRCPSGPAVAVPHVDPSHVERVLAAMDGSCALAAIPATARVEYPELMAVLRVLFGVVVFAPQAIEQLERKLSGTEITRFAGAPYEIERPYWNNMAAVRQMLGGLDQLAVELTTNDSASRLLRRLHVVALLGDDLRTFYKPASPISARGVRPGAFLVGSTRTVDTEDGTLVLDGPRANVSFVGGETYHRALYAVLDDPEAIEPRASIDSDGLDWGRIVRARARGDERSADWFCPPRPMLDGHFDRLFEPLRSALQFARTRRSREVVRELARFHHRFVHLHPFRCANQCIAMALVNHVLAHSHGVGMPHHILDHLGLRLTLEAYERVFATAVSVFVLPELSALDRYRELARRKARYYGFVGRLAQVGSVKAALNEVQSDPETARLALFSG